MHLGYAIEMGDIHGSAASLLTCTVDFGVGGLEKFPRSDKREV